MRSRQRAVRDHSVRADPPMAPANPTQRGRWSHPSTDALAVAWKRQSQRNATHCRSPRGWGLCTRLGHVLAIFRELGAPALHEPSLNSVVWHRHLDVAGRRLVAIGRFHDLTPWQHFQQNPTRPRCQQEPVYADQKVPHNTLRHVVGTSRADRRRDTTSDAMRGWPSQERQPTANRGGHRGPRIAATASRCSSAPIP